MITTLFAVFQSYDLNPISPFPTIYLSKKYIKIKFHFMGEIGQYHWVIRHLAIWCAIVGRVIPKYQLLKFVLIIFFHYKYIFKGTSHRYWTHTLSIGEHCKRYIHRIFFFLWDKRGLLLITLADLCLWCERKKLKVNNLKVKKK